MTNPITLLPKPEIRGRAQRSGSDTAIRHWTLADNLSISTVAVSADTAVPFVNTEVSLWTGAYSPSTNDEVEVEAGTYSNSERIGVSVSRKQRDATGLLAGRQRITAGLTRDQAEELYEQLGEALGK